MAKAAQRANGQGAAGGGSGGSASQRGPGDGADDVHTEFLQRIEEWYSAERFNIMEGRDCQLFYAGGKAQWDEKAWNTRQQKNRPSLTINRLPQFVRQATGDIRKNPPSLKFLPAKGQASQETAEALNGLARHIEQQSQAKDVYVKAVENAAQAGQGFFTVDCEYSDDDGFEQDIRIRPVLDPFGAGVDPFCTRFDKSDMRYGFVFDYLTPKQYEEQWPDAAASSIPKAGFGLQFPWRINDTITIAAYWRRVPSRKTLYLLQSGAVVDDKKMIPPDDGVKSEREVESYKVEMYRMSGSAVLDGPHPWAGRYIPLCMVVGEEITQSGSTVRKGMINDARDPQRIYNYARSASVEAVALQPKSPWVATVDQVKNRPEWANSGAENSSVLIYNADPKAKGPPERAQPAIASQGMDTQAMIAAQDMQAVTGIYNDSLGAPSQQHSGVAIANKQREGDTGTFLYPDNLGRAIGYAGKILCDLMPKIYDNERQIRILKEDGVAEMITINQQGPQMPPEEGKKATPIYDLQMGEYDVVVTTGPSFATQRREAAENMIQMVQANPALFGIAGDLIVKNMDWPGADELAKRIEKTMPKGLIEDGPVEPPPPNPKDAADAMKTAAQADLYKAQTEGQEITNAEMLVQMHATLIQVQQMMQGGPPPQGMGAPPQEMPPNGQGSPMGGPPQGAPDALPTVEVGSLEPPKVVKTPHGDVQVSPA